MTITEHISPPSVPTPVYHRNLRAHLEGTEPQLWAWFSESLDPPADEIAEAELDLLKTTYRLDGDVNSVLAADAVLIANQLGLEFEVVLYQQLDDGARNARVIILRDTVHIVFSGDFLTLLSPAEQRAVVAHELGHVALLSSEDGAFQVLDGLVNRMADFPTAHDAIEETARRLRLHTEVYADAISAHCCDLNDIVTAVVKISSGIQNVDATAYIRQAEEILATDASQAIAQTHPELHIRVACMVANAAAGQSGANPELVDKLINGPDDLDRVDLLGQLRLQDLTRSVIAGGGSCVGVSDDVGSYMVSFNLTSPDSDEVDLIADGELADGHPSVRFFAASLLVDLAFVADATANDLPIIRALSREARRIGVDSEFDKIFSKATERTLAEVRKLRKKAE